jgi:hypothetical protein
MKERLKAPNRISCFKYNYGLEEQVTNMPAYQGYLQLDEESTQLNLYLKKPVESPEYILESDPKVLYQVREEFQAGLKFD